MSTPGKRPFWMHQIVEYALGAAFIAQGLQSRTPVVPTLLGGLVMINAACAQGPLSAFRVFGRRMHRLLDLVVVAAILVGAAQPFIEIDNSTRLIMAMLGLAQAFIWWQTDFSESAKAARKGAAATTTAAGQPAPARARPEPDGTPADTIGRTAGRLVGKGVNMYRARKPTPKT